MVRLFATLVLIGAAWWLLRRLFVFAARRRAAVRHQTPPRFEKTVRCARCGAYTPPALARAEGERYICRAHGADAHERGRG